jgi:hypothetical protein
MGIDDKFRFDEPPEAVLQELGDMVDAAEGAIHARLDYHGQLSQLNSRLVTPMTEEEICTYAASRSRDDLILAHLAPDPHGYTGLTDEEMYDLDYRADVRQSRKGLPVAFLLADIGDKLEINAQCPEGTVTSLPAFQEMGEPRTVLAQLKGAKRVFHL